PPHLPVLRPAGPRPDARPHRPAPSRRRAHVGEPRHGLQRLQPPEGPQDARRGAVPPEPSAVRAAERRVLDVHAIPRRSAQRALADLPVPGAGLSDSARRAEAAIAEAVPAAVRAILETLWSNGHAAYVV